MKTRRCVTFVLTLGIVVVCGAACSKQTPSTPVIVYVEITATPPPATATPTPTFTPQPSVTPNPTPTDTPRSPTRTPTPTATPLPAGTLFIEEFGSMQAAEQKGWTFASDQTVQYAWSPAGLAVSLKKKTTTTWNTPGGDYGNFGAELEAEAKGDGYGEYGLVFRAGDDERYFFGVTTEGRYFLRKMIDGEWASAPLNNVASSAIERGKATNRLGVLARGSELAFYINGTSVRTITDKSLTKGKVGIFAGSGSSVPVEVVFTRLTVLTLDQATAEWGAPPATATPPKSPGATATHAAVTPTPAPPPSKAAPTAPPSAPGVDLVAARGGESCVNKFVSVSYPWEQEPGEGSRHMYYWDKNWSVYPQYARPNIKIQTAEGICNDQNQCEGFRADFCVYVDGNAPPGGTYESILTLIIFSAFPDGGGQHLIAEIKIPFTWYIQ